jgi:hypothetical protein
MAFTSYEKAVCRTLIFCCQDLSAEQSTKTNETDSEIQALRVDKPNKHVQVDEIKT